ncbi:hypothetical protein KIW84_035239 [Lathyrus oleraceus]|uniref:Protein TIC 214 n=1 Tax=Pisum sativum TaxID=3888 RepID=A0A9D4Y370_PEA|nr:hypothetical protein KIW84_035239 [Pisum sativum]
MNSAVVIGLYYGFLTTIAIGPSYVLLIQAHVMEKEAFETEIAATTGFITGRLMIFISIYYTPLHLALNRPHTVSFLQVPYLFFYFLYHNENHFYRSAWVSDLSSGYKDPVLVDSGYKNPNSIRNSPSPYYYGAEMGDYDENREEEIQAAIDPNETNQEDIIVYLSQNEKKETTSNNINIDKNKKLAPLEKSLVTTLFDYNRWSRPLRYIENHKFNRIEKDENSQFFFQTCESDGKKRISFTLSSEINEISKEVPRWEYQLIDDIEVGLNPAIHTKDPQICCRLPGEQIVFSCETLFSKTDEAYNRDFSRKHPSIDPSTDFRIPHFLREMDFDREIIRGSVHGQRRKIAILKLFQANVHSPIFVDNYPFGGLFDDIVQYVKEYFRKPGTDNSEFLQFQKVQEERRKEDQNDEIENRLEKIEEA